MGGTAEEIGDREERDDQTVPARCIRGNQGMEKTSTPVVQLIRQHRGDYRLIAIF
jgi:hypothetical protein